MCLCKEHMVQIGQDLVKNSSQTSKLAMENLEKDKVRRKELKGMLFDYHTTVGPCQATYISRE